MYDKLTAFHITVNSDGSVAVKADGIEQSPVLDEQGATTIIAGNPVQPSFTAAGVMAAAVSLVNNAIQEHIVAHSRNTQALSGGTVLLATRPNA